jgi:hypothetical protein
MVDTSPGIMAVKVLKFLIGAYFTYVMVTFDIVVIVHNVIHEIVDHKQVHPDYLEILKKIAMFQAY